MSPACHALHSGAASIFLMLFRFSLLTTHHFLHAPLCFARSAIIRIQIVQHIVTPQHLYSYILHSLAAWPFASHRVNAHKSPSDVP